MSAHGVDRTGAAGGSGSALNPIDQTIFDAKGDLLAGTAADAAARLAVGANDTILMADSAQTTGLKWASPATARTALDVPTNAEAVLDSLVTTKGDIIVATANATPTRVGVGANGTVPMARSAATPGLAYVAALTKAIYGLTYANNAGDAVNDLDIATGGAMDATGAYWMTLASALTKQSDANWAVGTGAGGLDTGAVGNSDYYIWLIARSDTGVVDVLYSLSSTAPTMPGAGAYDFKRLIGWFKRAGGTIVAFKTYELSGGGLGFLWSATREDINLAATLTTARRTDAISVPLGFSVVADLLLFINDTNAGQCVYIYCPDANDEAASGSRATSIVVAASGGGRGAARVRTSATGTIASRADVATMDNYQVTTTGFEWARRN